MNDNQYLYYDETTGDWTPADLTTLANLNNPDLPICPLNADGTPGPQTTYAAIHKKATAGARWEHKPTPAKPTATPSTSSSTPSLPARAHHSTGTLSPATERNINHTLTYIRHTLTIFTFLFFSGVGILLSGTKNPAIGLLIGLALATIIIITLNILAKSSTSK